MNERANDCRLERILMSDPCPVILENWSTEWHQGRLFLNGDVSGHPSIADGRRVRTTRVVWLLGDAGIAQTATMNYILHNRR